MRRIVLFILLAMVILGNVFATYMFFTAPYPGANDFASRWAGARAFWREGVSPYSDRATDQIQRLIYGRVIQPEEEQAFDPGLFAYPFYTVFLLLPFVWVSYPLAEALWLVTLEICLLGGLLLCARTFRWRPPSWLLAFTGLWALFFYPHARALLLGQFSLFVFAMLAVTLWALQEQRDVLSGLTLALSTVKPQMVFLLIPLLGWWAIRERRWRFLASFVGVMSALFIASWLVEPAWLAGFIRQVMHYPSYTALGSPIWIITHIYLPQLGAWGEWVLSLLALGYLIVAWHQSLRAGTDRAWVWGVSVCLVVTNLVALRTATTNYVVFLMPFTLIFRALQRRRRGNLWIILIQVITLIGLWALFLATVVDKFEHPSVYLPLPLSFLVIFALFHPWKRNSNERDPMPSVHPPNGV